MTERGAEHPLPAVAGSVGAARAIVREAGTEVPEDTLADAELLVSELVSNAVRHGGAEIRLAVTRGEEDLEIRVFDDGAGEPRMRTTDCGPHEASGRGLMLVERLASQWGVESAPAGPGKIVWFRLDTGERAGPVQEAPGSGAGTSEDPGSGTSVGNNDTGEERLAWS